MPVRTCPVSVNQALICFRHPIAMLRLMRPRQIPYRIGVHWLEVALFSVGIVVSLALVVGDFQVKLPGSKFRPGQMEGHPIGRWLMLGFAALCLAILVRDIFWRVVFTESEIDYHFFWIHRRFQCDDLVSIRPVNRFNRTARFIFRDGREFRYELAYFDADYLLEVLKDQPSVLLEELAALRDALTPPELRQTQLEP